MAGAKNVHGPPAEHSIKGLNLHHLKGSVHGRQVKRNIYITLIQKVAAVRQAQNARKRISNDIYVCCITIYRILLDIQPLGES